MILKNIGGKIVLCHNKHSNNNNSPNSIYNNNSNNSNNNNNATISCSINKNYTNNIINDEYTISCFKEYLKKITICVIIGQLDTIIKECNKELIYKIFTKDISILIDHFNYFLQEISKSFFMFQNNNEQYNNISIPKKEKCNIQTLVNHLKNIQSNEVINLHEFYKMFNYCDLLNINRNDCILTSIEYMILFYKNITTAYNNINELIDLLCSNDLSHTDLNIIIDNFI